LTVGDVPKCSAWSLSPPDGAVEFLSLPQGWRAEGCITTAKGDTLLIMPTTRPRHFVTETDDLAEALNAAASRWPDLSRAQLLVRLALEGHRAAQQAQGDRRRRRLTAVHKHGGMLTGAYGPDYLERLHEEWPA
jgi:hypothetical protein